MIAKVTTGASFGGLSRYLHGEGPSAERDGGRDEGVALAGETGRERKAERVLWSATRNLAASDPKEVVREMEAAAAQSSRTRKALYHLSISFDEDDRPSRERMEAAADRVLKGLGLERHQAQLVAHGDTAHPHVHVMVNRVHPETGKAWNAHGDYARIERSLRELEKEWGLKRVAGHHGREAAEPAPDRAASRTTGEVRRERERGQAPLADRVRGDVGQRLRGARTWDELAGVLASKGYGVEAKGRGMVITGRRSDGTLERTKASKVDRALGRGRLERRFGETLAAYRTRTAGRELARGGEEVEGRAGRLRSGWGRLVRPRPTNERGGAVRDEKPRTRRGQAAMEREGARLRAALDGRPSSRTPGRGMVLALGSEVGGRREEAEEVRLTKVGMWKGGAVATVAVEASAARASERRRPFKTALRDPEARSALQDALRYGQARRQERGLRASLDKAEGLGRRIGRGEWGARRSGELEKAFGRDLAAAYARPDRARAAFERAVGERGAVGAGRLMREEPGRFGPLREGGAEAARAAACSGAAYAQAREAALGPGEVASLKRERAGAEREAEQLRASMAGRPSSRELERRLRERVLPERSRIRLEAALERVAPAVRVVVRAAARAVGGPER